MPAFKSKVKTLVEKFSVRRETYRSHIPVNYASFDVDYGYFHVCLSTYMGDFRPYPPQISTLDRIKSTAHPKVSKSVTVSAQTF